MRPLKEEFNIPIEYHDYDLTALMQVVYPDKRKIVAKMIYGLQNEGVKTIGDLLSLSRKDLLQMRGIGEKNILLICMILFTAANQEIEQAVEKPKKTVDHVDHIERLKNRYLNRLKRLEDK